MKKLLTYSLIATFSILLIPSSNAWDNWNTNILKIKGVCLHQSALYQATGGSFEEELAEQLDYAYPLAGESYRADSSMSLLKKYGKDTKLEWSETGLLDNDTYKVFITKATLVPEPGNKFDKFAVKVLIKGKHVGYVPSAFSYDVSLMMHKDKKKMIVVNSCISHYPGGHGPQVTLDLPYSFLGDTFETQRRMELWFHHNDYTEYGPGTRCTKYFSKWYCVNED